MSDECFNRWIFHGERISYSCIAWNYIQVEDNLLLWTDFECGFFFSYGGHLFAVIDSNIIQIISPIHIKVIHRLNHGQSVGRNLT